MSSSFLLSSAVMWTASSSESGGSGLASEGSGEKGVIIPRYADDAGEEDGETTDAGDVGILKDNDQTQNRRWQRRKMLETCGRS